MPNLKKMFWKDVLAELDDGQVKWDAEKRDLSMGDIHHSIFELDLRLQRVNKRATNHGDIYPIADSILKVRRALVTGSLDDIEEQLKLLLCEKYRKGWGVLQRTVSDSNLLNQISSAN